MTVTLTSPVLGKNVGDPYTGKMEAWLLSEGYAERAGYTGPGVANTGAMTSVLPADDPQLAENREEPYWPASDNVGTMANDATNLNKTKFPAPANRDVDDDGLVDAADGDQEPDAPAAP